MSGGINQQRTEPMERQALHYRDFNLRFSHFNEKDGTFKVWVEGESPGGTMKPDDATQRTYDPQAFWDDPEAGTGGLVGDLEMRRLAKEKMFELGALLADLALPEGRVRTLFRQSLAALDEGQGLRVRLRIDPVGLVHLPWEYMVLPQASGEPQATDFLALRPGISIVRTDTVESAERQLPDRPVALAIGVLSSPDDQKDLDVDEDKDAIEKAVQALNQAAGQDLVELRWADRPATLDALDRVLADGADIFHFAGHATYEKTSREGKLVLEKADFKSHFYSGEKLAQLLSGAGVRLVVLDACETGRRDGQNVWSGVAPALTRQKIPAVIANQFKIRDINAIRVASKVYHRVLAGYTVDEALFEARSAMYQHSGLENRDWGVPVLYLHDRDGVLFPPPEPSATEAPSHIPFMDIAIKARQVAGEVLGLKIDEITGSVERLPGFDIDIDVGTVEKGGKVTGAEIGKIN